MHRQHVDDVCLVVAWLVAVAEQVRGDRVAVGLVPYQNAAESVASLRVERFEERAKALRHPNLGAGLSPDGGPAFGGSLG